MKPRRPAATVAVVSDLHCGSTIGLCPPLLQMDDGGYYQTSTAQRWLWDNWLDFCAQAKAMARGNRLVVIANGDLVEGNHHHTTQLVSENPHTQAVVAEGVLAMLAGGGKSRLYVFRGTEAHVGQSGSSEEGIAKNLGAVIDEEYGTHSRWSGLLDVDGVMLDVAHHGTMGRKPGTKTNPLNGLAVDTICRYVEHGSFPPDLVIRSHLHQYGDTGSNYRSIRVIATPAWQLATAYVNKVAPRSIADIGGLLIACYGPKEYDVKLVRYTPIGMHVAHVVRLS